MLPRSGGGSSIKDYSVDSYLFLLSDIVTVRACGLLVGLCCEPPL
jgi:hypothetical protein